MRKKQLLLPAFLLTATLTLASCNSGSRNSSVPYGTLDTSKTIASSEAKDITLSLDTYYAKLRNGGYNIVFDQIKTALYEKQISAVKSLLFKNYSDLTSEELKTLSYDGNAISSERFDELKTKYYKSASDSLANAIINTTTLEGYNDLKPAEDDSDYAKAIYKYVQSQNKLGVKIDSSSISFAQDANDEDHILIDLAKFYEKAPTIVDSYILDYADDFYTGQKLYEIADQEYILADEDDTVKTKNSYYLFKDEKYESTYDSKYNNYGTYNAIVITFASRKEAMETIESVFGDPSYDITSLQDYLDIYNYYYSSQQEDGKPFVITDDCFQYTIDKNGSDFDDVDSGVKELITTTLEDGQFLTEPRNLSGNYVLVYRNSTVYEASGSSEQLKWDELPTATKEEYIKKIQISLIEENIVGYTSTVLKKLIKDSDLKIYDPVFETKFYNSYTDQYTLIDSKDFNNELIFKLGDFEYKVESFYEAASNKLGLSIINEYFEQSYAANYIDTYVDSDTQTSNSDTLKSVIESWKKGNNSTYPKTIGLENFLVANYGYKTQDEVLKYYYNAKSALSDYLSQNIFDEWAVEDTSKSTDDTKVYTMSDSCKALMNTLLSTGNSTYSNIFSINLDHILIFIDFDNDGSPDDPEKYLAKHPELKDEFEAAVSALAKAIYTEAINEAYEGNSIYKILSYIAEQFTKGSSLRAGDVNGDGVNDTWDDYKTKFRFQLKAEQLASSGDITQTSVSNFVVPFADYVKAVYAKATETNTSVDEDYGAFFTAADGKLTTLADSSKITIDTLCTTVYGYHLLVLNSYDGPDSLKFTKDDNDPNGYQSEIKLLITEDEDDSSNNIYITIDSYNNDSADAATINQLFIYYIETKRGTSTSLDSNINSVLQTLFADVISKYTSTNFQTLVLIDEIGIKSTDESISSMLEVNRQYYVDLVCNYGDDNDLYLDWCEIENHSTFVRPNQK